MNKKIVIVPLAILVLAGSWFAYSKFQESRYMDQLRPNIKCATLHVANTLRYEIESGTKITYKELFEKIESDISEIEKKKLEIQSIENPRYAKRNSAVITYMNSSQELLRALQLKYRKQLAVSSASDWFDSSLQDLRESSSYSYEYSKRRLDKALADLSKANSEYQASVTELIDASKKMSESLKAALSHLPGELLVSQASLEKIISINTPKESKPAQPGA